MLEEGPPTGSTAEDLPTSEALLSDFADFVTTSLSAAINTDHVSERLLAISQGFLDRHGRHITKEKGEEIVAKRLELLRHLSR